MNCFHFVRMITFSTSFIFFLPDLFLWFELLFKSLCSSAGDKSVIFQLGYNLLKILEIFSVKQEANTFETSLCGTFLSERPFNRETNWYRSFWINVSVKSTPKKLYLLLTARPFNSAKFSKTRLTKITTFKSSCPVQHVFGWTFMSIVSYLHKRNP